MHLSRKYRTRDRGWKNGRSEEGIRFSSIRERTSLLQWRMNDDEASLDNVHGLMVPVSPHTRYENDIKGHVTGKVRSARLS